MLFLYLLLLLDSLLIIATIGTVVTGVLYGGALLFQFIECVEYDGRSSLFPRIEKFKKTALSILIPCAIVLTFVPSSKQLAVIYTAGNAIEYIQNNEKIQELPDKTVECLNKFLDEYLSETN